MEGTVKEIGVALSSSVDEFREERLELGDFIRFLNTHIYKQRKIHLDWYVCEDESGAVTHERRQEVFNAKIKQTRFFFLLVGRHIGKYTREEFDVALALFNASRDRLDLESRDIPKIFPCFKEMPHEERTAEAQAFRTHLHSDVNGGQYSLKYNHLDTLKLRMLTEFGRDIVLGGKVTVEDETAQMDGQPVTAINIGKIPAYANHRNLKRLRRQKAKLDAEFAELSLLYHAGDADAGEERLLVSQERNELSEKIHAIEGAVLDAFNLVAEMARERQTERAEVATRLLEAGEYEQAQAILQSVDSPEIRADWERAEQMAAAGLESVRALIQENRLRIQTLLAQGVNTKTLPELEGCFKQSADAARKHHMEPQAVYDYMGFLLNQHDLVHAIQIGKYLEKWYELDDMNPDSIANLKNRLGICYWESNNSELAETYYRDSLAIRRELAKSNPEIYDSEVATSCNNLAILIPLNNLAEAESLHQEALRIRRRLALKNPKFDVDVAQTCHNLGNFLKNTKRMAEAEQYYLEALAIRKRLAKDNPTAFEKHIAWTENNLAILLRSTNRFDEAEPLFRDSLEVRRHLAFMNPAAYEPSLAKTCLDFGILLCLMGKIDESEELLLESYTIRQRLAASNSVAYESDIARTCYFMALLELKKGNKEKSKEMFETALSLYAKYPRMSKYVEYCRNQLKENF